MSIELIAVGIDGALLSDQKTCSRERFMAQYQQMKAQGIRFVTASGNQYYQLISFFPEAANRITFVAENGGQVVSEGRDVLNGELSEDAFAIVVEYLPTHPEVGIIACGKNSAYTLKKYNDVVKTAAEIYHHRLRYTDNFDDLEDIFFRFGLNLSNKLIPQVQKALHKTIGSITVPVHIGNGSIDSIIPGVCKANGLRQLQELWGIDDSEVVVFDDGGSDIEMPCQAGSSFAMENAGSTVITAAKYRIGSGDRGGVLDVIGKVLKHEAPFK